MASLALSRDRDVRLAIAALLESTRAFDGVYLRSVSEVPGRRAGDTRAVCVEPDSVSFDAPWGDDATAPSPGSGSLVVSGQLRFTFLVRDDDPASRDDVAERLVNVAANVLNDVPLAGLTMPQFTRFVSLKWLPPEPPERQVSATFAYRYAVDSWNSLGTTE